MKIISGFVATCCILLTPATLSAQSSTQTEKAQKENKSDIVFGKAGSRGEQWLVVELALEKNLATEKLLIAWFQETKDIYLPLAQLSAFVEFPIETDLSGQKATGWFLSPDRKISIDFKNGTARVDGQTESLEDKHWLKDYGDYYIASKKLEEWLPLDFSFKRKTLSVRVKGTQTLPVEKRLRRKKRLEQMSVREGGKGPQYERVDIPYDFLSIPSHDLYIQGQTPDSTSRSPSLDDPAGEYRLRGTGDVGWMTGQWFFTGDEKEPLRRGRATMVRRDPGGELLGPAEATEIEIGDIPAADTPVAGHAERGRGVTISSFPIRRPDSLGTTTISGELKTGWEVELYRNDQFLGVRESGPAGKYHFREVELEYGWNEMKLVFFGPYGQKRTEYEYYHIGPEMTEPGQGYGRVSVQQADLGVFEGDRELSRHRGRVHAIGEAEYGLTQRLSLVGGMSHVPIDETERGSYAFVGARGFTGRVYTAVDAVADIQRGEAVRGHFNTRLGSLNLVGEHIQTFRDFRVEQQDDLLSESMLRLNGHIPFVIPLPYSLTLNYLRREDNRPNRVDGELQYSTSFLGIHLRNGLRGLLLREDWQQLSGHTTLRSRQQTWALETSVNYDFKPVQQIQNWRQRIRYFFSDRVTMGVRGNVSFTDPMLYNVSTRLEAQPNALKWGAEFGWQSRLGYNALLSVSMGIGADPFSPRPRITEPNQTSRGNIYARVFWDKNNSGTFDKTDEPIEGVKFQVKGTTRPNRTNKDGVVKLEDLPNYEYTSIEISSKTLKHPLALPTVEGRSIVSRPGATKVIDFPIVKGGEVDGRVYYRSKGEQKQMGGVCVQAYSKKDSEVVATGTTAFDGFYYLSQIPPGNHEIRICPEYLKSHSVEQTSSIEVRIKADGTLLRGKDLVLTPSN